MLITALAHLAQHQPLYLACSGGRDSLSLAYACYLLHQADKLPQLPILLHVHHGMQAANDDWAKFVAKWAMQHGFVHHILYVTLDKKTETQARQMRYQAFADVMPDGGILLLGHHQNDQAETVLMRLVNGAGVDGLSGMKVWQKKTIGKKTILLHRPFLSLSRQTITAFATTHHLAFIDDPTNEQDDYTRNCIRHQILPKLTHINPQTIANIARSAYLLAQSREIIADVVQAHLSACRHTLDTPPYYQVLAVDKLTTHHQAQLISMLHRWIQGDEPLPPNQQTTHTLLALVERTNTDHQTQIFWQGQRAFLMCRYQQRLYRYDYRLWQLFTLTLPAHINITNDVTLIKAHQGIRWQFYRHALADNFTHQPMHLQPLLPNEKITVLLNGRAKQLAGKKLYQSLQIPPWLRNNLWLLYIHHQPAMLLSLEQHWLLDSPYTIKLAKALDASTRLFDISADA